MSAAKRLIFVFHANGFNKGTYRPLVHEIALKLSSLEEPILEVEPGQPKYLEHYKINANNTGFGSSNNNREHVNVVLVDLMGHGDGPTLDSVGIKSLAERMAIFDEQGKYITNIVKAYKEKICPEKTYSFGHSLGGGCIMNALLNYASNTNAGAAGTFSQVGANAQHQQLFDKVLLFEPMQLINPSVPDAFGRCIIDEDFFEASPIAQSALRRKNGWNSLDEARNYFYSKTFYKSWDPRCLDNYMMDGLKYDSFKNQYVLKCAPFTEAMLFATGIDPVTYEQKLQNTRFLGDPKNGAGIAKTKIKVLIGGKMAQSKSKKVLWTEEKILEVFSGVIKCFPENISWDQIDGGHLYPIEDVRGFVNMLMDEFELRRESCTSAHSSSGNSKL